MKGIYVKENKHLLIEDTTPSGARNDMRKTTKKTVKNNEATMSLTFDETKNKTVEVLGVPQDTFERVLNRYALYCEEDFIVSKKKIMEKFGNEKAAKEALRAMDDNGHEGMLEFQKVTGVTASKTVRFKNFLESEMFKSVGWKPSTANDFLVLGILFERHNQDEKKEVCGALEALAELIKR